MSVYYLSVSAFNIVSKDVFSRLSGQDRSGQDRSGQDRSGQDRTGLDRTGQDWTGQEWVWDVQFPEVIFKRRTFPLIYYGLLVRYKRKCFEA